MCGARKLKHFYKVLLPLLAVIIGGCNQTNQSDIVSLLDARSHTINTKDIAAYADLLSDDYHQNKHTKEDMLLQMHALFKRFQVIQMNIQSRHIDIIDEHHALCEQRYILKVMADNQWRSIIQHEQLQLSKQHKQWKISAGL